MSEPNGPPTNGRLLGPDLRRPQLGRPHAGAGRTGPPGARQPHGAEASARGRTYPSAATPPPSSRTRSPWGWALLATAERGLATGQLGAPALRALLRNLYGGVFVHRGGTSAKDRFRARHGQTPGDFLVISPGKACNLRCEGCYANSGAHKEKLAWPVLERIVSEAHREWGTRVFVISGGEPLAYRSEGKGILDLAERFPDCFFVMYTNGTLIDDTVARRMGELGNLSPALSVEGMKEKTDARRGDGVFDKVLAAMERLRREGVIYGISLTATRRTPRRSWATRSWTPSSSGWGPSTPSSSTTCPSAGPSPSIS